MAQQAKTTAVATASQNAGNIVSGSLKELFSTPEIRKTISDTLGPARVQTFIGSALSVAQDPKISAIEPTSVFNCLLKSATYNFPIDPALGYAHIVPYKNKNDVKVAQFQIGVKGIVELALRTGQYRRLNVKDVREGEVRGLDFYGEVDIQWNTKNRNELPIVGYMAAYELMNGMTKRVYWSIDKIKEHANRYSKAHQNAIKTKDFGDDLWTNSFDAMAQKTVLKDLLKYAPKSIELQNALQFDQAVIERKNGVEKPIYVDNENNSEIFDTDTIYNMPNEESVKNETSSTQEEVTADGEIIKVVPYAEYINHTEKYEKVNYPDGSDGYKVINGKKTMRVKVIKAQV